MQRSIGAMKYRPMWLNHLFLDVVSSILFFLQQWRTSANTPSVAVSFWTSRIVFSAMYHFQSGLSEAISVIQETQQMIKWSHCSGRVSSLLLILMDWAIIQIRYLTWLSLRCAVHPPCSCQIPIVSAVHWQTPTPAFWAQRWTCWVGIWIVVASVTTDFSNQKMSHLCLGCQRRSMIEWWITNSRYSKAGLEVLNILSRVMQCSSSGEEGVLKVVEILCKVGRQGEYICGHEGVILIWWHHLGCYSARNQFPLH